MTSLSAYYSRADISPRINFIQQYLILLCIISKIAAVRNHLVVITRDQSSKQSANFRSTLKKRKVCNENINLDHCEYLLDIRRHIVRYKRLVLTF